MSTPPLLLDPLVPEPGPHLHSGVSSATMTRAFLIATAPVMAAGVILFGRTAAWVLLSAVLGAVGGEVLVFHLAPRGSRRHLGHAALIGLLLGLTLAPTVGWPVALLGGLAAVGVGKGLLGGYGNYLWHPALVGWAVLELSFGAQLAPSHWPVLARNRLLSGSLEAAADVAAYRGYPWSDPPWGADAWGLTRPIDHLVGCYGPRAGESGLTAAGWLALFRDRLPPWRDTLWGTVGGGIGETCTLALLLGGLALGYCGRLRWRSPAAAIGAVALLAAVLPIRLDGRLTWLPVLTVQEGFPTGVAWMLFHLTADGLWLSCLLLAADPPTTPLTVRGRLLFGLGLGVLTMAARWFGLTPGSSYWAVLAMNTLVPLIDRVTRRRLRVHHFRFGAESG